jgi:hypothetical protein
VPYLIYFSIFFHLSSKDPSLWVQVLSYFASCEENCSDKIAEVLKSIISITFHYSPALDSTNILPPLLVIQILASKPNVTLGVVKDYIIGKLEREQAMIVEVQFYFLSSCF